MGLTVVLDTNVNDYSVTNGNFDGFKAINRQNNFKQNFKTNFLLCFNRYWLTQVIVSRMLLIEV